MVCFLCFLQMALETAPTAEFVGNAFVEQYYHILHHNPELVYRFYDNSSVLSRPGSDGVMTSVTTMQVSFIIGLSYHVFLWTCCKVRCSTLSLVNPTLRCSISAS